jgi:hypothetical protein
VAESAFFSTVSGIEKYIRERRPEEAIKVRARREGEAQPQTATPQP